MFCCRFVVIFIRVVSLCSKHTLLLLELFLLLLWLYSSIVSFGSYLLFCLLQIIQEIGEQLIEMSCVNPELKIALYARSSPTRQSNSLGKDSRFLEQ